MILLTEDQDGISVLITLFWMYSSFFSCIEYILLIVAKYPYAGFVELIKSHHWFSVTAEEISSPHHWIHETDRLFQQ